MTIPCVVIQWEDAEKTRFSVVNYDFNVTFLPVIGLDPNLEILVKRTPFGVPAHDTRLKVLVTSQNLLDQFDAEYPTQRIWQTTYSLQDRSPEEKCESVCELENDANYKVFPNKKQLKFLTLALAIIDRKADGLTITAKQQGILDKLQTKAQKFWTNHLLCADKKAAITAGQECDLDAGWENADPEL